MVGCAQETVLSFMGEIHTGRYVVQIGCDECGRWHPLYVVDDRGAPHPIDIGFPELILGRDALRYHHLSLDGPRGEWTIEVDHEAWPESVDELPAGRPPTLH